MSWINREVRLPKHGQWVVITFGDAFKVGRFDATHPMAPLVIDRDTGKWWSGFTHWKPLTKPKP